MLDSLPDAFLLGCYLRIPNDASIQRGRAYPCVMDPMLALIERLRKAAVDIDKRLEAALMEVDVRHFSDMDPTPFFHDRPLVFLETPSGGVKTISAPHMVASLLLNLELETGQTVLLLGSKGGYMGAIIAELVGPEGEVIILDPSIEVVEHAINRLHSYSNCIVHELTDINRTPIDLPEVLHRVLITGSLKQPPKWLEERLGEGGFIVAPLGNPLQQTLVKRENQAGELLDTDLGNVVFGPVDIAESEPSLPGPHELADILEEASVVMRDHFSFGPEIIEKIDDLVANLRHLPEDLEPPKIVFPVDSEPSSDDDVILGDGDKEDGASNEVVLAPDGSIPEDSINAHPLIELLHAEEDWLSGLWPILAMLFDVRMTHPGAPTDGDEGHDFDLGDVHEDFIP